MNAFLALTNTAQRLAAGQGVAVAAFLVTTKTTTIKG